MVVAGVQGRSEKEGKVEMTKVTMPPMSLKEAEQVRKTAQANGFKVAYIISGNDSHIVVEVSKK